jgi:FG-GAP-like repeat
MAHRRANLWALVGVLAIGDAILIFGRSPATVRSNEIPFEHINVDGHPPANQWCKTVGDVNGDGFIDIISSGSNKGGMFWYEYPDWKKHTIDETGSFGVDMQVADIDADGDLDAIIPEMETKQVRWYENPGPRGSPASDPWKVHVIGSYSQLGFLSAHDVEIGDLNQDGKPDVVIANQKWEPPRPVNKPELLVFFQAAPDSWEPVLISRVYGEGTVIADVNGDGRPDIVRPGLWLENPGDPVRNEWREHWIIRDWPDRAGIAVADINKDGREDVFLAAAESTGRLSWFESTDLGREKWIEHIVDASVDFVHTFKLADVNLDGEHDIVFAEMQQSARKRVGFYLNLGKGSRWKLQVLATTGSHNIRTADIDSDGDIDIVGANWNTENDPNRAPLELWRNLLKQPGGPTKP